VRQVLNLPIQNLIDNNEAFHKMLTEGIEVEYLVDGNIRGDKIWLIDWQDIANNEFLACNQFTVIVVLSMFIKVSQLFITTNFPWE